ncbi:MAG TPA: pyridoxamine 5'-phosphate oxidase family protein [Egibacteraceae bacterium]
MRESPDDIRRLQELLDRSYARAGAHLTSIHTPQARLTAQQLVDALQGMQIFVVATTTADGRPRTGPLDSFLYRGELRFGTAPTARRAQHLARSPAVSATHVRGETLVVTVHGNARPLDLAGADRDFAELLRDHYGAESYEQFLGSGVYYGVDAEWLFAADMSVYAQTPS